jgi:hypothetical protein
VAAPSGIIVAFLGAHAAQPTGWARKTALDAVYPSGAGAGDAPGTTGGAATHTHTVTDHTHTQDSHLHAVTYTATGGGGMYRTGSNCQGTHSHYGTNTNGTIAVNQTATITLNTSDSNPPYYTVIWVESAGTHDIPANCVAYFQSLTPPTGWNLCDGNNTTPNLTDKYLRGAATNADAGGSGAGSITHTHTQVAAHTHTQDAHSHTGTSGTMDTAVSDGTGTQVSNNPDHTHTFTTASYAAVNQNANVTVNDGTNEPAYRGLAPVKNNGTNDTPIGIIALWTGALANIPIGWSLCDGANTTPDLRDKFVKCITSGALEGTGGSNSHGHTAAAHSHTQDAHSTTHNGNTDSGGGNAITRNTSAHNSLGAHVHAMTVGTATATNQDTTIALADADGRPPFYEVAYVKYLYSSAFLPRESVVNYQDAGLIM